jgi:hypothetical protein
VPWTFAAGLLPATAQAQEISNGEAARGGDWTLHFLKTNDKDPELLRFERLLLAIERRCGARSALRLGMDVSIDRSSRDDRRVEATSTSVSSRFDREDIDRDATRVELDWVHHGSGAGRWGWFWTLGPSLAFMRRDGTRFHEFDTARSWRSTSTLRYHDWVAGVRGALGVQWFPWYRFGLAAEQGAMASYYFGDAKGKDSETEQPDRKGQSEYRSFWLGRSAIRFGMLVRL